MTPLHRTTRAVAVLAVSLLVVLAFSPLLPAAAAMPSLDTYRIQPGDALVITVLGEENLGGTRSVGPSGTIQLPVVGTLSVAGQSLNEARAAITKALRDVLRDPYVTVGFDENSSQRRVYVEGRVDKMGSQLVPVGSTVLDALMAAGLSEDADLSGVQISRADGATAKVDLSGLRTGDPLPRNLSVGWDDHIFVPRYDARVTLVGEVQKPGSYLLPQGRKLRLLELLTTVAGGFTESAERDRLLLMRDGRPEPEKIDLVKLMKEGDLRQNYELLPGDVVVLPDAERVSVAGEVTQPYAIYAPPKMTLLEAVTRAGGFTPLAGLRQAKINHADGRSTGVDLEALWRRGDLALNQPLKPGDVLMVPRADPEEVLFTGAVVRSGTYDLRDLKDRSLVRAMAFVGANPNADLTRVSVYRGSQHLVLNARVAMEKGDRRQNAELLPGDVVYVPDSERIIFLGAWGRNGHQNWDSKLTLMDYVALAGGVSNGHPDRTVLIRPLPDGTAETIHLDLRAMERGTLPEPVQVKPGDILYCPPIRQKSNWIVALREILWTVGSINSLFD